VLKEDIVKVFCDFHAIGKFERSLNATFIALLLKIPRVVDLKDFCTICLVSGIYKIIAKILANRPKMVLEKLLLHCRMLSSEEGIS
jgi:hypothetical protein